MTDELKHTEQELNRCPLCGSDHISYTDSFADGGMPVACGDCNATWWEVWTYAGVDLIEEGAQ